MSRDSANRKSPYFKPPKRGYCWFFNEDIARIHEVGAAAFAVFAVLRATDWGKGCSFLNQASIADTLKLTPRAVQASIARLLEAGWIATQRYVDGRRGNTYIILGPPPTEAREGNFASREEAKETSSITRRKLRPSHEGNFTSDTKETSPVIRRSEEDEIEKDETEDRVDPKGTFCSMRRNLRVTWDDDFVTSVLEVCKEKFATGPRAVFAGKLLTADRVLLLKVGALLVSGQLSEGAVDSALEAIRKNSKPIAKKAAYFTTVLTDVVKGEGGNLRQLLAKIDVPDELHEPQKKAG